MLSIKKREKYDSIIAANLAGTSYEQIAEQQHVSTALVRQVASFYSHALSGAPLTDKFYNLNRGLALWAEEKVNVSPSCPDSEAPAAVNLRNPSLPEDVAYELYDRVYASYLHEHSTKAASQKCNVSYNSAKHIIQIRRDIEKGKPITAINLKKCGRVIRWATLRAAPAPSTEVPPTSALDSTAEIQAETLALSGEKQALFLTMLFTELFYLASTGDTSLPFPPISYGEKASALLAYRLGGVRTAVYAMGYETEYLKWRKSVLGEYDIDEKFGDKEAPK